jgi:large subunit ribosomal protein L9|tara:strand:- start:578 stop:1033 length:456 start_codon:yes stop_codon:yes gene_type:complete
MKVILLEHIKKLGSIGEIIDVKRGFARNFLISKKKALFASKENIKEVEKIKLDLNKKNQEKRKEAKDIFEKLKNKQFIIKKLSTENKELYGSVKPTEISKIIFDENKIEVKPSMIQLKDDIKTLGTFKAEVNLHPEVQVEIKIEVIAAEAA